MSPALAWLIAELTKMVVLQVSNAGKYDSLTEAEAQSVALSIGATLSTALPSPQDLESGAAPAAPAAPGA
jgi:hypothetical protein